MEQFDFSFGGDFCGRTHSLRPLQDERFVALLNRYGIPCRIVRDRSIRRGCGYHIIVRGDLQRILALLSQHGIKAGKESS